MCQCSSLTRHQKTSFLEDGRVFGTWDFKWPQDTVIDVYFQAMPSRDLKGLSGMGVVPSTFSFSDEEKNRLSKATNEFGKLTRVVENLARRWLAGPGATSIDFRFHHDEPLPAPAADDSRSVLTKDDPIKHYDVLVSLASLPQARKANTKWKNKQTTPIFLPGSELGRYAQRADYGIPTTYLGKREQLDLTPSEYFVSKEFWNWCVHEFGHVLGLPHEHQNPKIHAQLKLREAGQIVEALQIALKNTKTGDLNTNITLGEIEEEITTAWPAVRDRQTKAVLYSDFRDYEEGAVPDDDSSIMLHIFWKRLLEGANGTESANFHERPTQSDLEHLRSMYPS